MNVCIGFPRGKLFHGAIQIMRFHERAYEAIKKHCGSGRILYSETRVCLMCREKPSLAIHGFSGRPNFLSVCSEQTRNVIPCCDQPGYCKADITQKLNFIKVVG